MQDQSAVTQGTLHAVVVSYYKSAIFKRLRESTRKVRRGILDGLCVDYGRLPAAAMEARHIPKLRDAKAEYPASANVRVKALRQVFAWAMEDGLVNNNPARDVAYIPATNRDGFHTWTVDEVGQFEARHPIGTKARLALALMLYTGVRRSDVVRLGPQIERGGWLHFTMTKGQKAYQVPVLTALRTVVDASPSGHLAYLETFFDKPFTSNGFGNWFRKRCNEAGLPHCSAHGLRKTGATFAAENSATESQLMAIFGWANPK